MKQKIILASTSLRRHELAKAMGLDFEVIPSKYEEDMTKELSPEKLVIGISLWKG